MKPILNIENLTKIYGNVPSQTKALNGITFQVMPGEFLGIMGSSGSGKSTLLNCIATVIQPTGGSIQVEGDTLQSLKGKALAEYRGKKVGYLYATGESESTVKKPVIPSMQSVLIGSEYPVMDTLLFYVKNGEKLELSIITRSRTHSSLTLCSVSRSMYCFVMPQSRPKRSRLFTSTTSTFPARTASVSSCRAGRSRVNPEPCSAATPTMVYPACSA